MIAESAKSAIDLHCQLMLQWSRDHVIAESDSAASLLAAALRFNGAAIM